MAYTKLSVIIVIIIISLMITLFSYHCILIVSHCSQTLAYSMQQMVPTICRCQSQKLNKNSREPQNYRTQSSLTCLKVEGMQSRRLKGHVHIHT